MIKVASINEELQTFIREQGHTAPPGVLESNANVITKLKSEKKEEQALHAPDFAPKFIAPSDSGEDLALEEALKSGPVILTFYRGQWCPFCNIQMRAYQRNLEQYEKLGAKLVALSPQLPQFSEEMRQNADIRYTLLWDKNNEIAAQFGLVFPVPDEIKNVFAAFGLSISAYNGVETDEIPIPATYVVAPDFRILYSFVDADFTRRAEPVEIMLALKKYAAASQN